MSEFQAVASLSEIPEGKSLSVEFNDQMVAIFNHEGNLYAIEDSCPHMGAPLAGGHFEDCVVTCPLHAWRFDVRTGAWCDSPRVKIDTFQVRVEGGEVWLAAAEKEVSGEADAADDPECA